MVPFSAQLRCWRQSRGYSQGELALRAGMPRPNLVDLETGRRDCTVRTLIKIAEALAVSPGTLLDQRPEGISSLNRFEIDEVARGVISGIRSKKGGLREVQEAVAPLVRPLLRASGSMGYALAMRRRRSARDAKREAEALLGRELVGQIVRRVAKLLAGGL